MAPSSSERSADDPAEIGLVRICECWPRDGLQPWAPFVPTEQKVAVLDALRRAGVPEVDVTAFSPTKQFADAVEVIAAASERWPPGSARILAVNERSFEAIAAAKERVDLTGWSCGFPLSASEVHNLANLRCDIATRQRQVERMVDLCRRDSMVPLLCIACAFGYPEAGDVPVERVLELGRWAHELGVRRLMLSDTTGLATPFAVQQLFTRAAEELPGVELIAHLHDTRGTGMANAFAAVLAGVRTFDCSLGGTGGEPAGILPDQVGETGNLCTEDFVSALEASGVRTGIDVPQLLQAGLAVEGVYGRRLRSQVLRQRAETTGPAVTRSAS